MITEMNIATITPTAPVKLQLKEMYLRHGFHVAEKQGFLFISFGSPEKVNIITKYVQSDTALTFEQVKTIHEQFLKVGKAFNCHQYRIICRAGFNEDALFFQDLNIALSGKKYLDSLQSISHIELYSHNDIAYSRLCSMLQTNAKACIIQPTGTGKSLIISKFITDRPEEKFVVLAPGKFVIGEIKKHLLNVEHAKFFTYSKLTNLTVKEVKNLRPDYIIVDEFHRCGAEEWGAGVELLIKTYPDAKLIGTTATHIRYLDDKRNMADELFEGNIAHHLTLSKALALGILPTPKYVSALYKFDEEYLRVKKSIADSMAEDKKILLERLNKIKLEFENTDSIPQILQEHLTGDIQKIIVFAKDIKHLRKHKAMVLDWFKSIGYDNIFAYEVHSENEAKNKVIFKDFEQPHDRLDVMFSVNMLNEGIHVKGVNCIIMLRDTESPIIYYQQMGRCLTVGAEKPLIFDLVNNFANIRHRNLVNDVNEDFKRQSEFYKSKGIGYDEISFEIIDKVRDIKELLDEVETTADNWSVFFKKLEDFKAQYGHCNVPHNYSDKWLAVRVTTTRVAYKKGTLKQWIIDKLTEIGFAWGVHADSWRMFFEKLEDYKKEFGHCDVTRRYSDKWLAGKVSSTRSAYKNGTLEQWVIDELNELGFLWDVKISNDDSWYEFFERLEAFYTEYGDYSVPQRYKDKWLAGKVQTTRQAYRKGILEQWVIDELNELGFVWDVREDSYNLFIEKLEDYKAQYGHCNVPHNYSDKWLAAKVHRTRRDFKNGTLEQWVVDKLIEMGFLWGVRDDSWNVFFEKLEEFKAEKGHCNVTSRYSDKWLAGKVQTTRQAYRNGTLEQWIIDKLTEIGFAWGVHADSWRMFFEKLEAYKKEFGNCNVLKGYKDKWLARRVGDTRKAYKKGKLEQWVVDRLNELGFSWGVRDDSWNVFFERLEAFKKEFGHCNVPYNYSDKWLAIKVSNARQAFKKGTLEQWVVDRLNEMGFVWNLK